ncbi:MAG: hypothetical protein NTY75_02845 [Candidatus Shapirobacteria bacterium]|nr:hypothetical protein [Candidatus Shapirobacteria bacterium]
MKNWFIRHKVWTGVIVLLLIIGVANTIGYNQSGNSKSPDQSPAPTATATPQITNTPTAVKNPNAITLDDLALAIMLVDPSNSKTDFTDGKYIVYSKDGNSNITLSGSKDDISDIDLNLNHLDKSEMTADTGVQLVSELVNGAIPEWKTADTWLQSAYKSFSTSKEDAPSKTTKIGNKTITMTYNVGYSSLYLTISTTN